MQTQTREFYHGANGDKILHIIRLGVLWPDAEHKLYFSPWRFDSVLMHGGDMKRNATFATKLQVKIPEDAVLKQQPTEGVPDTLIITTSRPLEAVVLELYIREPGGSTVKVLRGIQGITEYLA